MRWIIRNELTERVAPAWFGLRGVTVEAASDALAEEIRLRGGEIQACYRDPAAALPAFTPARRMYHAIGLDPSKTRPSSEALVRRILLGKGLYRVNTAVDAANLASITVHRSIGLYDADRIEPLLPSEAAIATDSPARSSEAGAGVGVIILRLGRAGEEYGGIGKETIHLEGRPALFDQQGPFGNPSADSDRTRVTPETKRLLFVLFEGHTEPRGEIDRRLGVCRQIMQRHLGGEIDN